MAALPSTRSRSRRVRAGVSLIEIAVVIAISGIMTAIASQSMVNLMPSWRTKQAAKEFYGHVQQARDLAIAEGAQYRVVIESWDTAPTADSGSVGSYEIQRNDGTVASPTWDVLPIAGVNPMQGTYDFSDGAADALHWVSLEEPTVTTITFDSRGFIDSAYNSSSDFGSTGMINFVFFNKRALVTDGTNEWWEVSVSRAGFARLTGTYTTAIGAAPGNAASSNFNTSTGSGYAP